MPCMGYSRLVWDSQPSKWSSWCSWLSRQSNTLKVLGSNPGEDILFCFFPKALRDNRTTRATSARVPATSRIDQEGLEASAGSLPSPNRWIFAICRVSLFFVPRGLQQDIPILNEKQLVQRRATRVHRVQHVLRQYARLSQLSPFQSAPFWLHPTQCRHVVDRPIASVP